MLDGYLGYSAADWSRLSNTTLAKHLREVQTPILRNYQMSALIESRGRVTMNNGGRGLDWPVRYKLHDIEGDVGEGPRAIQRSSQYKKAYLEYRGYNVSDSMSRAEFYANKSMEAIVPLFNGMGDRLKQSLSQRLGSQFYVNGYQAGNEKKWHGFESMFSTNGTLNITNNTQRSANASDPIGYPNGAYGGIDETLGGISGQPESGVPWPNGDCSPDYDFWSPMIINYTSSYFGATSWAANCVKAMRFAIAQATRRAGTESQATNIILARNLYIDFKNAYETTQRIVVSEDLPLRKLGFTQVMSFDGVEVSTEAGCPNNVGYGLNPSNIELMCCTGQLFEPEQVPYSPEDQSFKWVVSTLSNLKFEGPSNFIKFAALGVIDAATSPKGFDRHRS